MPKLMKYDGLPDDFDNDEIKVARTHLQTR